MNEIARRRVLMLIPEMGYGGAERSFINLKRILEEMHTVLAVGFERGYGSQDGRFDEVTGFRFLHEPGPRPGLVLRLWRWVERYRRLRQLKLQHGTEVCISFLEGADILNVLTCCGEKIVVSIRGSKRFDPHITGGQGFLRRVLIWPCIYPRADAVVGISAGVSAEVRDLGFVGSNARLETIGLALRVSELMALARDPVEIEIAQLQSCPVIVSWGRLSDEKGYQHLVEVFARIKLMMPGVKLLLIGDGPLRDQLVSAAQRLGLRVGLTAATAECSDLILLGYRENPIRYAKIAKIFVLSSIAEGFSNALVEALAAGIPVLAADCPWGARSVLSSEPPDVSTPYPTQKPTFSTFGVLMPRIDLQGHKEAWVSTLMLALAGGRHYDEYRRIGPMRAMDFDESRVASRWLELVESLVHK